MNVLMIAYFFPPDSSSGAFRPMYFARDLRAAGHRVTVLTVREEDFFPYQAKDPQLILTVGEGVRVVRAPLFDLHRRLVEVRNRLLRRAPAVNHAAAAASSTPATNHSLHKSRLQELKDLVTDVMAIPDQYNGWIRSAVRVGRQVVRDDDIDVIYATGNPWSSLLVGVKLKRLTGKPLVLDFRDPWVGQPNYFAKRPFCQRQEAKLERRTVFCADHVIANTPELRADLQRRYPFLTDDRISVITNGFEDFMPAEGVDPSSALTITHAGTLNLRNPKALLQAAIRLIERGVVPAEKLRLVMLGGIEVPDPELPGVMAHPALQNVVQILPRMPYREAIKVQQRSDVLLLLQPNDFPLQIPRKLYEYIAFRKPILGIAAAESATARMIRNHQLGMVVDDEPEAIASALESLYRQWERGGMEVPATQGEAFRNRNLSARLEAVLQTVIGPRVPS